MTALPQLSVADAALIQLQETLAGRVRTTRQERMLWATDASPYQVEPLAVVEPMHAADVEATVRWCAAQDLPVLPRGAGTSLAGQTVSRAVVVDCSVHMTACEIDVAARRAVVGPGLVLDDLRAAARPHGLTFGAEVSTSAQATLGGMVGNNSAGLHSLWWGMTGDHVRAVDVVLHDGARVRLARGADTTDKRVIDLCEQVAAIVSNCAELIDDRYPRVLRNNGGYALDKLLAQLRAGTGIDELNLARLICGSEGTLAFVTSIQVDLVPIPAHVGLAVAGFASVPEALDAMPEVLAVQPSAVELLDADVITRARAHGAYADLVDMLPRVAGGDPTAVLYVDCFAESPDDLRAKLGALQAKLGDVPVIQAMAPDTQRNLWDLRKHGLGLITGGWSDTRPTPGVEDCAVPVEQLAAFQRDFTAMLQRHGVEATWYAHASVGLLHARPRLNMKTDAHRTTFEAISRESLGLVREHGGSISGEHGDGRIRGALVHAWYGAELVEAFRAIKQVFDPSERFNPGVITDAPGLTDDLRVDDMQQVQLPDPYYHWAVEGSFLRAAEQCNGQGLCRRTDAGAMCPSYRATRSERHATRGRGNALRLALSGQITPGEAAFDDQETAHTLDLCLGCKACRYECPSQVDVAKLKSEFEAQRWRARGGPPLRTRIKANVRLLNRLTGAVAPLANALHRFGPTAALLKRFMGMDARRTLPTVSGPLRHVSTLPDTAPALLLYPDCFTMWNDPAIGHDTIRLLEAFGWRVILMQADCCGRTACSAGVLDTAVRQIEASAPAVHTAMRKHRALAVVAVEPSCATALQQEWGELRTNVPAEAIASASGAAHTVTSFLLQHWDDHPRRPAFTPEQQRVIVHVHCHQKHRSSQVGEVLRRCGCEVVDVLDSGCCGMAGSFGYEHHDLSAAIAEQSLGAAMASRGDAHVVAHGTSCRHQLADMFSVQAAHPASFLAARLAT